MLLQDWIVFGMAVGVTIVVGIWYYVKENISRHSEDQESRGNNLFEWEIRQSDLTAVRFLLVLIICFTIGLLFKVLIDWRLVSMGMPLQNIIAFTKNDLFTGSLLIIIMLIIFSLTVIHFLGLKGRYILTDQGIFIRKKFFSWQKCRYFKKDRMYFWGLYKILFKNKTCILVYDKPPPPFYAAGMELWINNSDLSAVESILTRHSQKLV